MAINPEGARKSFWSTDSAAERYAEGRPYFHPAVIDLIQRRIGLTGRMPLGLDVACGSGQSTHALRAIADEVIGFDVSEAMLRQAKPADGVRFEQAPSEKLPVDDGSADIITVCNGFHWFDKPLFLAESVRVLRPGGWLAIYENHFKAQMLENSDFKSWCNSGYGTRFPTPPRSAYTPAEDEIEASGLIYDGVEEYSNQVRFTPPELVSYLMTHSNVVNAVEYGDESAESARGWLLSEVEPLFTGDAATFQFGGTINYARKPVTL